MSRILYLGNVSDNHIPNTPGFSPAHSTENHVKLALRNLRHECLPLLEAGLDWSTLPGIVNSTQPDVVLWTRTAGFDPPGSPDIQTQALIRIDIPTVGFHLDRWWGLNRQPDIFRSPFFRLDFLFTADGGHDEEWEKAQVNHYWSPPAILSDETKLGTYRPDLAADVGFVGNLRKYGHPEWGPYRLSLFKFLTRTYGNRFRLWEGGMRGRDLADLYQSVKVLVGDSCLAGGSTRYWSDRIPETLGRGGFLIHPYVGGILEQHPGLSTYGLGDFDGPGWGSLRWKIDRALEEEDERRENAVAQRQHVIENHTYEHRLARLLSIVLG